MSIIDEDWYRFEEEGTEGRGGAEDGDLPPKWNQKTTLFKMNTFYQIELTV